MQEVFHFIYRCILIFEYSFLSYLIIYFSKMGLRFIQIFERDGTTNGSKKARYFLKALSVFYISCYVFNIVNSFQCLYIIAQ